MPTQIALLRGINVGGHKPVAMAELRDFITGLGFRSVKTLLQSGNLVFEAGSKSGSSLEKLLEQETVKGLGVAIDYMVRSAKDWAAIVEANPFPKEAKTDPGRLVVMCLKIAPAAKALKSLQESIKGPEFFRSNGKELYIVYPNGQGTSKFTGALIERTLNSRGTARNWNTILKLLALASGADN
jgi:uncharacterized protein (DUF1697 family)